MSSHQQQQMETAFELISKGNEREEDDDWWSAADSFGQAMATLESLSNELAKHANQKEEADSNVQEQIKISQLYGRQSFEYRIRARACFVKALTLENDKDKGARDTDAESDTRNEPLCVTISEDEAERRCFIFSNLFSNGTLDTQVKEGHREDNEDVTRKQESLEERLAELNAALPSGFKTSAERVSELNRGLRRLGVSLYSHEERPSIESEPSEEEQVQQILSQAKDEVRFGIDDENEERLKGKSESTITNVDETESEDSFHSESSDPQRKKRKAIMKEVVKAQIHLAQLVAMLDIESQDDSLIEDGISDDDESRSEFHLDDSKTKLIEARECLEVALCAWTADEVNNSK